MSCSATTAKLLRDTTLPLTWQTGELVAYYTRDGQPEYCRIIDIAYPERARRVRLNSQGSPLECSEIITLPQGQACNERGEGVEGPTKWKVRLDTEGRVTGIAGISFPRTEIYEAKLASGETMSIRAMTAKFITRDQVNRTTKRPTCERPRRWPVELRLGPGENIVWKEVWDTFKIGLATPVDFGTRFRMIMGDLGTRSKRGEPGGCRLGCGCRTEKHIHLLECPRLRPLWSKLTQILERARGSQFGKLSQAILLGWTTDQGPIEKGSTALFSMLLKIMNIEWYMVIHKSKLRLRQSLEHILDTRAAAMERNGTRQRVRAQEHTPKRQQDQVDMDRDK